MATMKAGFLSQGNEGIVKAQAIEDRLMRDSWRSEGSDLTPKLSALRIPTLVIYGDHDFIPREIAVHIAKAIPNAALVTLKDCGHFAYLECGDEARQAFGDFFRRRRAWLGGRIDPAVATAAASMPITRASPRPCDGRERKRTIPSSVRRPEAW